MKRSTAYSLQCSLTRASRGVIVLVAIFVIAGCTRGSQGIFATIEVEEETKTSNLVDNTSATALVRADLGGDRFIVRAGSKIFTRLNSGSDWSAISAPSGYLPVFLAGIDTDSSGDGVLEEVYAVFFDSTRDRDYLYQLTAGTGGALSWTEISNTTVWDPAAGTRITGFQGVGDRLLLSSSDGTDGRLYSIAAGAASRVNLGAFTPDDRGIQGVATDGSNTVVIGENLHVTSDLATSGTLSDAATTIPHGRGVSVFPSTLSSGDPADTFLLVTLDGKLYTSTDGNSWTAAASGSSIPDRSFSGVAWVDHEALLVVGSISYDGEDIEGETTARGYYEVSTSSSGAPYSFSFTNDNISDNYDGSELATSGIARLAYFDGGAGSTLLFALTHGKGLWRTAYESSGPEWFWE